MGYGNDHDGNCVRLADKCGGHGGGHTEDRVGSQIDQLFCKRLHPIRIITGPAKFDPEVAAFRPPQLRERAPERREPRLHSRIALRKADQYADPPNWTDLLRVRGERPRSCRATKKRNEFPSPHGPCPQAEDHTLAHRGLSTVHRMQ